MSGKIPWVIAARALSGDDASRASVPATRGWNRVFAVITSGLGGQAFFEIAENAAVFVGINERATLANGAQDFLRFGRQCGGGDRAKAAFLPEFTRVSACAKNPGQRQQQH